MGGMDIWCSPIERNGTYGKPFPLPFNTTADEVTPFFHQQKQVLYFSSNWAGSESGFDIYQSANTWSGTPTTAARSTAGCRYSLFSTSMQYTFCPPRTTMSFLRSSSHR